MKLLWLDLNSSYAHSSLALPALHAQMMDDKTIEWQVVSATINENTGDIASRIYNLQPDIVASTCWLFNHEALMHILARAKALLPHCCIVLGGPEFLGNNEAFLRRNPFVGFVFRGEGEEIFPHWLKSRCEGTDNWRGMEGFCYIDTNGTYRDCGIARVHDFAALTAPEESPLFNWSKPFVQLETTRGCFNTCAFCVSGGEKPIRALPTETIERRIANIHRHGIRNIRLLDRTFNYNPRRAAELLDIFRRYPDIRFHLEIHPALLTDELKQQLATLPKGLLHLEAGMQSLREPVLEACRRTGTAEDALKGLDYLCDLRNMETHADLIAGLPHYSLHDLYDDVRTLIRYWVKEIQLESLKVLPGTEMRRRADELGIRYSPLPPYEVLESDAMSPDDMQTARHLSRLIDGFYNAPAWQDDFRELVREYPRFLHRLIDYLKDKGIIDTPLSLERRGLLLYDFCREFYPDYTNDIADSWITAGMSLKKAPAKTARTKHVTPPEEWEVIYGTYHEGMRLCFLPLEDDYHGFWYGFDTESQNPKPIFKAYN